MEKQEIVSELYSIRAGLSLISENLDIARQAQEKKGAMKKAVSNRQDEYHKSKCDLPQIQTQKEEIISKKQELYETKAAYLKKIASLHRDKEPEKRDIMRCVRSHFFLHQNFDLSFRIVTNALYWFITFLVTVFIVGKAGIEGSILLGAIAVIIGLSLYPVVLAIIYAAKRKGLIENYTQAFNSDHNKELAEWESKKRGLDYDIAKIEKELEELTKKESIHTLSQQNYWTEIAELTKKSEANDTVCDRIVDHCIQENNSIRNCLIGNYSSVLTVADWPNIDLLIFYFNTGRADTLKEALQLVDEQRRNDAIVHAIGSASREISNTIQRNFNNLSSMLSAHFSRINMQIEDLSFRMDKLGDAVGEATELLRGQISQLTEANRLQTAFMKKAVKSTAELVDDMNRATEVKVAINY